MSKGVLQATRRRGLSASGTGATKGREKSVKEQIHQQWDNDGCAGCEGWNAPNPSRGEVVSPMQMYLTWHLASD